MQRKPNQLQDLQKRLQQSERDKLQLKRSIQELNQCYLTKVNILQNTVEAYENRIEELLQLRKSQIDKQLSFATKFEEENKKLMGIIENLYSQFEEQKIKLNDQITRRDQRLGAITEQRDALINKSQDNELKIDQLVREHTVQIQKLKKQLLFLKEQVNQDSNQGQRYDQDNLESYEQKYEQEYENEQENIIVPNALRQITDLNQKNQCGEQETRIKQLNKGNSLINLGESQLIE